MVTRVKRKGPPRRKRGKTRSMSVRIDEARTKLEALESMHELREIEDKTRALREAVKNRSIGRKR